MKITDSDKERAAAYQQCQPKQFGNLHERMKYVMALLERDKHSESTIGCALWHALFDLQTEVSYHKPASPPYGRRTSRFGE